MTPDERLRAALHAAAGVPPTGGPALRGRLLAQAAVRRRRRTTGAGLVVLFAVAASAALALPRTDDQASRVKTGPADRPTTTTSAESDDARTTLSTDPPAEPVLAAVVADGRVLLLDGRGVEIQELASALPAPERQAFVPGVAFAADRRTVWFSRTGPCDPDPAVFQAPADGSAVPVQVAAGNFPAVSPDGQLLAYAAPGGRFLGTAESCTNALVVRHLPTGRERFWQPSHGDGYTDMGSITRLAWAPDSRRLALEFSNEGTGVFVVDTGREVGPLVSTWTRPEVPDFSASPSWRTDDQLGVVVRCCAEEAEPAHAVRVDPGTGDDVQRLGAAWFLDYGPHRRLLWLSEGGELWIQEPSGRPRTLTVNVVAADW